MKMKNKLYCHHKHKVSLVMRNFFFATLGIFVISLAVTIPTYLSIQKESGVPTLASENTPEEEEPVVVEETNDN